MNGEVERMRRVLDAMPATAWRVVGVRLLDNTEVSGTIDSDDRQGIVLDVLAAAASIAVHKEEKGRTPEDREQLIRKIAGASCATSCEDCRDEARWVLSALDRLGYEISAPPAGGTVPTDPPAGVVHLRRSVSSVEWEATSSTGVPLEWAPSPSPLTSRRLLSHRRRSE